MKAMPMVVSGMLLLFNNIKPLWMTEMNYYLLKLEMVAKFYVCSIQVQINGIYVFGL